MASPQQPASRYDGDGARVFDLETLGDKPCHFVLVSDNGYFSEFGTFSITDWLGHAPKELLAKNFGLPASSFENFPKNEVISPRGRSRPLSPLFLCMAGRRRRSRTNIFFFPKDPMKHLVRCGIWEIARGLLAEWTYVALTAAPDQRRKSTPRIAGQHEILCRRRSPLHAYAALVIVSALWPYPIMNRIMLPLLCFVAEGERPVQTAVAALAEKFKLSQEERQALIPSGRATVFQSRVGWAATYLVQAGLLSRPRRGALQITERGRSVLAENPPAIDNQLLSRFAEFNAFRERSRSGTGLVEVNKEPLPLAQSLQETPKQAPEERIDIAFQELAAALRAELLDRIRAAQPAFFEQLIVDLMLAMGYGAGGGGQRLGRPNDEGIDGVITEDPLGLDTVYLQAKRYGADVVVGIKDIQAFIGALVGHGASKGVFVTTSHFSNQAQEFARKATHQRVMLIDGEELTRLLVRYGVGVRTARTIELRGIDENYFESGD